MKKIVMGVVASALLGGATLSADFINYKALNNLHINVEGASMSMGDTDTTGMEYGIGYDYFTDNYLFGFNYNAVAPSDDALSEYSFGSMQIDAGYRVTNKFTAYGILSYDIEFNTPLDGVGLGVGVKYQVLPYVALNAKYKTTSMSGSTVNSFDYDTLNFGIEFNFRTGDNKDRW